MKTLIPKPSEGKVRAKFTEKDDFKKSIINFSPSKLS
jgi:hypothetical protein